MISSLIGKCSMARKHMFKMMHMTRKRSANGCVIILSAKSLSFIQQGEQSQMKQVLANLSQYRGHFFLDVSDSEMREENRQLFKNCSDSSLDLSQKA